MKKRWFSYEANVYRARVLMFVGSRKEMCDSIYDFMVGKEFGMKPEDAKSFASVAKEHFGNERDEFDGECLSISCGELGKIWIVRMDDFEQTIDRIVVLSHECLHAALSILGDCGISENPPFEALCYLHESIFMKLLKDTCSNGSKPYQKGKNAKKVE